MLADQTVSAVCPHLVFRDVLGAAMVAELLDYVGERETSFKPAVVRDRTTGERRVDTRQRSAVAFGDVGRFQAPIEDFVGRIAPAALKQLNLAETNLEVRGFELTSFRNGTRFGAHIDTDERTTRVRVLSCVYYFAKTPRRFSGGELRLFGLPTLAFGNTPGFVDVVPEADTMVMFPSWLRHEVRPVQVPSGAWTDGRFTINCWLHRPGPAP